MQIPPNLDIFLMVTIHLDWLIAGTFREAAKRLIDRNPGHMSLVSRYGAPLQHQLLTNCPWQEIVIIDI
jgi:hypothetical protein